MPEKVQCPPSEARYWSRRPPGIKRPISTISRLVFEKNSPCEERGGKRGGTREENLLYCTEILNPLKEDREKIGGEGEDDRENKGEEKRDFILYILLRKIV